MEELVAQEAQLHACQVHFDAKILGRLLHADFREVGMSGHSISRASILSLPRADNPILGRIHAQDYVGQSLSTNTYMLTYKTAFINSNGAVNGFAKRVSIWVKTISGWQLIYHQGTQCERFELAHGQYLQPNLG